MLFLAEAKNLIFEKKLVLVRRSKNLQTLFELGWTETDLASFLNTLTPRNYVQGPEQDIDIPGEDVWIFGAEIDKMEFYFKLKINRVEDDDTIVCISFHKAECPLQYPYADQVGR
jgi:hypothetical protein